MKKEIIYTVPYSTEAEIYKAKEIKQYLQEKYDDVAIYPNGLHESRIICTMELEHMCREHGDIIKGNVDPCDIPY